MSVRSALLAALVLSSAVSGVGRAEPSGLLGRWRMVRDASSFSEGVTGPTPDEALMEVTRDDPGGLSYVLIERRVGAEIGRASYQLSFAGSPSRILVDGRTTAVSATRSPTGDVTVNAPPRDGYWAVIRIKRTGPESVVVEHAVDSASGEIPLESVAMIRASPSVTVAPLAPER